MRSINTYTFALRKFLRTYINYIIYGYKYNIGYTFACAFCVSTSVKRRKHHDSAAGLEANPPSFRAFICHAQFGA